MRISASQLIAAGAVVVLLSPVLAGPPAPKAAKDAGERPILRPETPHDRMLSWLNGRKDLPEDRRGELRELVERSKTDLEPELEALLKLERRAAVLRGQIDRELAELRTKVGGLLNETQMASFDADLAAARPLREPAAGEPLRPEKNAGRPPGGKRPGFLKRLFGGGEKEPKDPDADDFFSDTGIDMNED